METKPRQGHAVSAPLEDIAWSERLVHAAINKEEITGFKINHKVVCHGDKMITEEVHIKPSLSDYSVPRSSGNTAMEPKVTPGTINPSGSASSGQNIVADGHASVVAPCKREPLSQEPGTIWKKNMKPSSGFVMDVSDEDEQSMIVGVPGHHVKREPHTGASTSSHSWQRSMRNTSHIVIDLEDEEDEAELNVDDNHAGEHLRDGSGMEVEAEKQEDDDIILAEIMAEMDENAGVDNMERDLELARMAQDEPTVGSLD